MTGRTIKTILTKQLGLHIPLIQAPMAGGATTPELVAAVSNAGALGSLGGAYLPPAELEKNIRQIKHLTTHPFAVNIFSPSPDPVLSPKQIEAAIEATNTYREELGLAEPRLDPPFAQNFEDQFDVILAERPAVFSFTFGIPDQKFLAECRNRKILTFGTATTLEEGQALERAGVSGIAAQGVEAGAQRGSFSPEKNDPFNGLAALVPTLVSALRTPIIAAGGIMNGTGIAAALALGGQAAQLGTAFLICDESGINETYRKALLDPNRRVTRLTRAFTGRWARGLENRFMVEMASKESGILPFPAQNVFTQDIRRKAAEKGASEYLSLWAGQGVGLIRAMKAEALVEILRYETEEALDRLLSTVST